MTIPTPPPKSLADLLDGLMSEAAKRISASAKAQKLTELDVEHCTKLSNQLYRGTKFSSINAKSSVFANLCGVWKIKLGDSRRTREEMYHLLKDPVYIYSSSFSWADTPLD